MDKIEKLEGFKLQISDHLELFGFINGFTTEEYYQEFSKEIDAYARAYFSSHFVEAVRKCIEIDLNSCSGYVDCKKQIIENAERLVKGEAKKEVGDKPQD